MDSYENYYEDIKDIVKDVYNEYREGLSPTIGGAFTYLCVEMELFDEFIEKDLTSNQKTFNCQTKEAFTFLVYFMYIFLKEGYDLDMAFMNCYYRSKDMFACKELEKEMAFIENLYKENFDKIPTKYEKPLLNKEGINIQIEEEYEGLQDQIEDVYDWYSCGDFSNTPDGAFAFLVDFRDMLPELIPNYGKRSRKENSLVYTCQTRKTFFVLVCFLYKFLKGGYCTDMNLMNCYYRSKDKFACKELVIEMAFIEKFYKENFDKIPTKYEKLLYIPKK